MKKFKFKGLGIEITRKCNKKCKHCMKGESQNISISKNIIDKLFLDVEDCNEIQLFGGEPLLEIDIIDYLVDKIIESNWNVTAIQLTTNGTIQDSKICDVFKKFCNSRQDRFTLLRISDDTFHNVNESTKTFNYYKPIVDKINKELGREAISLMTTSESEKNNRKFLIYSGRAVKYINENRNKFTPFGEIPVRCPCCYNHRVKIINNEILCALQISATGNIGLFEEQSFELDDKMSFGNIIDSNITSLIINHNNNCLLECKETEDMNTYGDTGKFVPNVNSDSRIYFEIVSLIFEKFNLARVIAKQRFKNISTEDIISNISFPSVNEEMLKLIERIYFKYNGIYFNPFSYTDALIYVRNKLKSNDFYVFPDYEFGTLNDLLNSYSFKYLEKLNEEYNN